MFFLLTKHSKRGIRMKGTKSDDTHTDELISCSWSSLSESYYQYKGNQAGSRKGSNLKKVLPGRSFWASRTSRTSKGSKQKKNKKRGTRSIQLRRRSLGRNTKYTTSPRNVPKTASYYTDISQISDFLKHQFFLTKQRNRT